MEIGPELARYALPRQPTDPGEAMRTSLRLLHLAPFPVTVPLLAATFRAPLASALPADLTLWLEGPTGSLKSTLAALFLSHYGPFDRTQLPGAWSATANHLEARAFALKDTLFVIDDWVPTPLDARELDQKASRLIRAQGNGTGRGRLRSDLTPRLPSPPRGLLVATGEQHPTGHSVLARTLIVDVRRDQMDIAAVGVAQAAAPRLPHAMAAFVTWLAPHMDGWAATLRLAFDGARTRATQGPAHLRLPEGVAHLWLGLDVALQFAVDIGACTPADDAALRREGWAALLTVATAHARLLDGERPTQRFLEVLAGLLDQQRVAVLPTSARPESRDARDPRPFIGWGDEAFLYLVPEAVYGAVSRACRATGEPFPVRPITVAAALAREGHLAHAPDRHSTVERLGGHPRRVWKVKRTALDAGASDDDRRDDDIPGVTAPGGEREPPHA